MPAHFAILRTAKLKSLGNVGGSLAHTYRTRETPNADPSRADQNEHSHATPGEVMQALRDKLPEKRRKDAVIGLEYFVGGSPEWFEGKTREQQDAYFREAVGWLEKRHGKENVVGWSIHRDESTPHLVAYVVPLDDKGKLNAKQWTGGPAALSKMQTDFAKTVGARHGLERGIEGSKAHHQTIKDFYAQIEKPGQHVTISPETVQPKVLKKGFLTNEYETPEMVAERLTAAVQKAYTPAVEAAKLAASERRRADEMTQTAQTLSRE
ncbi:TPA: MobV family relaxase, partial [Escherichia coli]